MMPMPSGMAPIANPWSARPTIIGTSAEVRAQSTEPPTITARQSSSSRFLPYRSPSRPMTGVATAPASRVAVITQVASATPVPSSTGRSLMTGTSRVCITATVIPAKARTATMPRPPPEEVGGTFGAGAGPGTCGKGDLQMSCGDGRAGGITPPHQLHVRRSWLTAPLFPVAARSGQAPRRHAPPHGTRQGAHRGSAERPGQGPDLASVMDLTRPARAE